MSTEKSHELDLEKLEKPSEPKELAPSEALAFLRKAQEKSPSYINAEDLADWLAMSIDDKLELVFRLSVGENQVNTAYRRNFGMMEQWVQKLCFDNYGIDPKQPVKPQLDAMVERGEAVLIPIDNEETKQ